jgi:hypothetical protein
MARDWMMVGSRRRVGRTREKNLEERGMVKVYCGSLGKRVNSR